MNETGQTPTTAEQVAAWPAELQQAFELAKEQIAMCEGIEPGPALDNLAAIEVCALMIEKLGAIQ